jgi:hypothetical protein
MRVRLPEDWVPEATAVLLDYLAVLAAGLVGSRRYRAGVVAELADGLIEATDARRDTGLDDLTAIRKAVAECGDPGELARLFVAEQAAGTACRTGRALVLTGPFVGAAWLVAAMARTGLGPLDQIQAVLTGSPLVLVVVVAVPAAIFAAAGGRFAVTPSWAAGLGAVAAVAAMVCDSAMLASLVGTAGWSWLAFVAGTVSALRLALSAVAANRCAKLRIAAR